MTTPFQVGDKVRVVAEGDFFHGNEGDTVTTLQVGDKVRVIAEDDFFEGVAGTVAKVVSGDKGVVYLVDIDVGSILFCGDELEKVTP